MMPALARRWNLETALLAVLAAGVSVVAILFNIRHGNLLLYGDAVAHINIARRVFDSRTPGLLHLGTVWLPLPHLLMLPFLLSHSLWRSGIGGSIPSLLAFVAGVLGVFRLVRDALSADGQAEPSVRASAWLAALIFAANPNVIYLQTTAMTEVLYLALFIWAMVFFGEFVRQAFRIDEDMRLASSRALVKCAWCLAAASLTRYDGWCLSVAIGAAATWVVLRARDESAVLSRGLRNFILLIAAVPIFWFGYNAAIYRNPLEFANGPYSARALDQKAYRSGQSPHPGSHDIKVATSFFLKSTELNLAPGNGGRIWLALALAGTLVAPLLDRRLAMLALLWIPLPFYILSIAYGGVPIFLPVWWPFSYYNLRYGLQLLPAIAVFVAVAFYFFIVLVRSPVARVMIASVFFLFVVENYLAVAKARPVCLLEAQLNSRSRIQLESVLASRLQRLPAGSIILMYLGDHVGALQQAGIPLRRVIQEGNHRTWRQPFDPQGLWERALADPGAHVDYVVAFDGDPVSSAAPLASLKVLSEIDAPGQPRARLFATHPSAR